MIIRTDKLRHLLFQAKYSEPQIKSFYSEDKYFVVERVGGGRLVVWCSRGNTSTKYWCYKPYPSNEATVQRLPYRTGSEELVLAISNWARG